MKLSAIHADLHSYEGKVNWAEPARLALSFDDGSLLRLGVGGDGATLRIDRLSLEGPIDMGEYGRVEVHDYADLLRPGLKGAELERVRVIRDSAGRVIGLALPLAGRETFCFWADEDRLYWGDEERLGTHDWLTGVEPRIAEPFDD